MLEFHLLVLVLLAKFVEYDDLNSLVESCTNASMDMTEREHNQQKVQEEKPLVSKKSYSLSKKSYRENRQMLF